MKGLIPSTLMRTVYKVRESQFRLPATLACKVGCSTNSYPGMIWRVLYKNNTFSMYLGTELLICCYVTF